MYDAPDWCHHSGFYLDPALIPPDDEAQDVAAWLAGRWDTLHATIQTFDLIVGDGAGSPGCGSGHKSSTAGYHLRASVRPSPTSFDLDAAAVSGCDADLPDTTQPLGGVGEHRGAIS